jgi:hypothetical protein
MDTQDLDELKMGIKAQPKRRSLVCFFKRLKGRQKGFEQKFDHRIVL